MTKPKTVLLWGQDDVLTESMELFLTAGQADAWKVIRPPASQSLASLAEQLRKIKPDLVILYQGRAADECDPLARLIQEHPALRAIVDQPELRVITVNLHSNVMQVYSKHSITVRQVSDLLSVIENWYFSENPVQEEVQEPAKKIRCESHSDHAEPIASEHRRKS